MTCEGVIRLCYVLLCCDVRGGLEADTEGDVELFAVGGKIFV